MMLQDVLYIDDVCVLRIPGAIEAGDWYVAERNTGPQLLLARAINKEDGYIVPDGPQYCYNINECFKVEIVDTMSP